MAKIKSHKDEAISLKNQAVHNALEAIGLDAASTAAQFAPVDTGRLRNSIDYEVLDAEDAVCIGTNVEYAPYHEFGTSRGIPARHYLQFGVTAHLKEYEKLVEKYLKG